MGSGRSRSTSSSAARPSNSGSHVRAVEHQREARRDHEVRDVRLRPAEHALLDPGVDPVEHARELSEDLGLLLRGGHPDAPADLRDDQAPSERAPVEEMSHPAVGGRATERRGVAHHRREHDAPRERLQRLVRPPLCRLDRLPLRGIVGQQRRLGMARIEESRDRTVGRDPLSAGCQRRDRAEPVTDADRQRTVLPAARVCPPASNPSSRATTGCKSVTTSTRRYGTRLCASMSIAARQACDPGIT